MFKNNESPLSLFSFQDIITCLTGIMLFFLLLLSIKIMEITKLFEQQSPYRAEIEEWQQRNELLKHQLQDIAKDIDSYRNRILNTKHEDRATLTITKFKLERELNDLRIGIKHLQKYQNLKVAEKESAESRQKQLDQQRVALQSLEKSNEAIQKQNESYEKNIKKLRYEIQKRKNSVDVSVSGNQNKQLIVLVCAKDAIRIVDPAQKSEIRIPVQGDFLSEMTNEACTRIGNYSHQEYCFMFLIKPSAGAYCQYLINTIQSAYSEITFGNEPILESEDYNL